MSKEFAIKESNKYRDESWGRTQLQVNRIQYRRQINPMKCDYKILSKSNELKYFVLVISKVAITIKKRKKVLSYKTGENYYTALFR